MSSAEIYTDLVYSSITHTLLQEQREAQVQVLESDLSRRAIHQGVVQVNIEPDAFAGENAAEKLQQMLSVYSNPNIDHQGNVEINITREPRER